MRRCVVKKLLTRHTKKASHRGREKTECFFLAYAKRMIRCCYFAPGRDAKHCDQCLLCLSVCLHVCPLVYINKSSAVAEMGDCLATIGMDRKWGGAALLWGVGGSPLSPHLTQCGLGRGHLFTKWHLDPSNRLATNVGMPRSSA